MQKRWDTQIFEKKMSDKTPAIPTRIDIDRYPFTNYFILVLLM